MNEFFRGPMWAGPAAQEFWSPKIFEAQRAWFHLERESVRAGLRRSALLILDPEQLVKFSTWCVNAGDLTLNILGTEGPRLRVVVTKPYLLKEWQAAWRSGVDRTIGSLLDFPPCCVRFFEEVWEKKELRDTTISQDLNTQNALYSHPGASLLLRWLGVRLVPHLPCSFNCTTTLNQADSFINLGLRIGLETGVTAIRDLLCLETEYSALHGIGTVRTPVFKFEFSTDYTKTEVKISRPGIRFELPPLPEPSSYSDNGFNSYDSMSMAHALVLTASGTMNGNVLDLGCGDGTLLAKLYVRNNLSRALGVEVDPGRVDRGRRRHGSLVQFFSGDIIDVCLKTSLVQDIDAVLLMPGRLLEMAEVERTEVRRKLQRIKKLLVYTYGDWGPLGELCDKTTLPRPKVIFKNAHAEAGVIER